MQNQDTKDLHVPSLDAVLEYSQDRTPISMYHIITEYRLELWDFRHHTINIIK